jgi:hypothetical protein
VQLFGYVSFLTQNTGGNMLKLTVVRPQQQKITECELCGGNQGCHFSIGDFYLCVYIYVSFSQKGKLINGSVCLHFCRGCLDNLLRKIAYFGPTDYAATASFYMSTTEVAGFTMLRNLVGSLNARVGQILSPVNLVFVMWWRDFTTDNGISSLLKKTSVQLTEPKLDWPTIFMHLNVLLEQNRDLLLKR